MFPILKQQSSMQEKKSFATADGNKTIFPQSVLACG